jgi:hypothetical protein
MALLSHSLFDAAADVRIASAIQFQSLNKAVGRNMAQQSRFFAVLRSEKINSGAGRNHLRVDRGALPFPSMRNTQPQLLCEGYI